VHEAIQRTGLLEDVSMYGQLLISRVFDGLRRLLGIAAGGPFAGTPRAGAGAAGGGAAAADSGRRFKVRSATSIDLPVSGAFLLAVAAAVVVVVVVCVCV
jgi:hypothetical protein